MSNLKYFSKDFSQGFTYSLPPIKEYCQVISAQVEYKKNQMHELLPNLLSCSLSCIWTYRDLGSTEPLWCAALLAVHALGLLSKQVCSPATQQTPAPPQTCVWQTTRLVLPQTTSGWRLPRLA